MIRTSSTRSVALALVIAPWDWRGRSTKTIVLGAAAVPVNAQAILLGAASAAEAPSPDCVIKAVTRNGQCIYHLPGDLWYVNINMLVGWHSRWFCSVEEAQAAGCRAAQAVDQN